MPTQNITLNVVPSGVPPIAYISQNDNGWTVQLNLMRGTTAYTLSSSYTNTVMTAVAGDVRCGIIIYDGNEHVETLNFILHVQKTALDPETIVDNSDVSKITLGSTTLTEAQLIALLELLE